MLDKGSILTCSFTSWITSIACWREQILPVSLPMTPGNTCSISWWKCKVKEQVSPFSLHLNYFDGVLKVSAKGTTLMTCFFTHNTYSVMYWESKIREQDPPASHHLEYFNRVLEASGKGTILITCFLTHIKTRLTMCWKSKGREQDSPASLHLNYFDHLLEEPAKGTMLLPVSLHTTLVQ